MVIVESEAVLIHGWSDYIVITAGGLICCWVHAEGRGLRSRVGLSHAEAQRAQRGRRGIFGELNLRHLSFLYYYLTLEAYFVLYAQVS